MKKVLLLAVMALAIPSVALAAKPPHPSQGGPGLHGKAAPKVMYVLKGTLSAYSAFDSGTNTNGSITIAVTHANHHGKALVGQTLTFPVGSATKVVLENGATTITDGDLGIVKIKAAKNIAAADLATTLQATNAFQVIDQGPASTG